MRTPTFAVVTAVCLFAGSAVSRAQTPPGGGWVVLPVDDYRDLRTRAGQSPPPAAATDATLTRIDYTLVVEGDVVLGRAALVIDVLGAGWAAVPLPAGLAVREASLDGQPLVLHAGPPPAVHLSRAGRATLELDVVFTPGAAAGVDTIALPASSAAVTRVALSVPGTTHVVSAAGGVVVDRAPGDLATQWTVHGRPATPLTLSWARRRDDPRTGEPLRLRARLDAAAALRDTLLQVTTTVELEVLQGVTRDVVLAVPSDVTVTAVTGALVDDWRVDGGRLRITFLETVASTIACVVRSESRLPAGTEVSLPMLRVPLAERETGRISVDVGGEAEVVAVAVQGLETLDGAGTTASPRARAFQWMPLAGTADRRLALTIARYAPAAVPVATVDEARYRVLASTSGALLVEAQYLVRNNQRSALTITLPPAARLWQARVDGRRLRPGAVDGARVLLPLDSAPSDSEPTAAVVSLVYLDRQPAWTGGARVRLVLPALTITLPPAARLWQARVDGRRLRPGAVDGARVLLPLDAAPSDSEPTAAVVSLVYLDRQPAWTGGARVRLVLPALDLPVARTGLLLHHPPSVRLEVEAGPLRLADDLGPFATPMAPPRPRSAAPAVDDTRSGAPAEVTALVARLRREQPGAATLVRDDGFSFPTVGPAVFLRSELTPDHESLALDLVLRPSR